MRHLDLFSGIGGFALAAESVWPDVEHIFCDIEPFAQAVLRKHWPEAKIYDDIKKLEGGGLGTIDIVTGGFPCQPFSAAGQRRGKEDDRHLWPEMLRVIREAAPRWVIGENVGGLLTWNGGMVLDEVYADLEREGYSVWAFVIPAAAVGAPHRRDRVWIIAHADGGTNGRETRGSPRTRGEERVQERDEVGLTRESGEARIFSDTDNNGSHGSENRKSSTSRGDSDAEGSHEVRKLTRSVASRSSTTNPTGKRSTGQRISVRQGRQNETTTHADGNGAASADSSSEQVGLSRQSRKVATDPDSNSPRLAGHGKAWPQAAGRTGLSTRKGYTEGRDCWSADWPETAALLCVVDDGLPDGLVRPKGWRNAALKSAGNAIVPQVAAQIMRTIKEIDI